tara:strand:- start:442 stop:810 length:369 start_codon:yes stop_codon:yes gene_type:complete
MMYQFFEFDELKCRCCGTMKMDDRFMRVIDVMRNDLDFPFVINSAYRCPEWDFQVGGHNVHTTGRALDISIALDKAFELLRYALDVGMTGIGLCQHGPHSQRFIHLDDLEREPRPRIWTYAR